jgi:putative transcriptional regulator
VPIVVTLDDMLHDRRMTLTQLGERVGMTLANLSILKTGKARAIRFSTLDAICEALACQPGDILRFEAERAEHVPPAGDAGSHDAGLQTRKQKAS